MKPIIFVCGHRKGGTSMFHNLFDGHSEVCVYPVDLNILYGYFPQFTQGTFSTQQLINRLDRVIFKDLEVSYVDGSIIGGPPQINLFPRFYVSGYNDNKINPLDGFGIEVRVLSDQVGDASALKMSYASITKGTTALYAAAEALCFKACDI